MIGYSKARDLKSLAVCKHYKRAERIDHGLHALKKIVSSNACLLSLFIGIFHKSTLSFLFKATMDLKTSFESRKRWDMNSRLHELEFRFV